MDKFYRYLKKFKWKLKDLITMSSNGIIRIKLCRYVYIQINIYLNKNNIGARSLIGFRNN